jgi:phosphate-selective porin OprO/OprP
MTTYCLTGEKRSYKNRALSNITPKNNFDFQKRTWGAWELALRYARFDADDDFFDSGIVKPEYSRKAESFNFGINWFLNPNVLVKTNYVHTDFDKNLAKEGKKLDNEDVFLMRFQLVY